jgi:hypothetical protein
MFVEPDAGNNTLFIDVIVCSIHGSVHVTRETKRHSMLHTFFRQ